MLYRTYIPKPPLSDFVELFWFDDGFPQGPHKKETPDPGRLYGVVITLRQDEIRVDDREN
jgi:hypothetical protein